MESVNKNNFSVTCMTAEFKAWLAACGNCMPVPWANFAINANRPVAPKSMPVLSSCSESKSKSDVNTRVRIRSSGV